MQFIRAFFCAGDDNGSSGGSVLYVVIGGQQTYFANRFRRDRKVGLDRRHSALTEKSFFHGDAVEGGFIGPFLTSAEPRGCCAGRSIACVNARQQGDEGSCRALAPSDLQRKSKDFSLRDSALYLGIFEIEWRCVRIDLNRLCRRAQL